MCGIFGFTGRKIPGVMESMQQSLRHRGPDDHGEYSDAKISMGMTRLSIIDLAGGHQPMSNEDGTVWVVFNGEIYNFLELREELEAQGHEFRTKSDTEVIVHGFEEYGVQVAQKLNGMFAIAVWNSKTRELFLIRDRYGVKPLFYADLPEALVFASEMKALFCHPSVKKEMDEEAFSHYLGLRNIPAPFTVYKDIRALLPGHVLIWKGGESRISRWYEFPMTVKWKDENERELIDRIDEILRESVRLRMRSDVAYGAYLSGGLDSSLVTAMMAKLAKGPVKTFCLTFADSPGHKQDAHFARLVARQYSTDHHEFVMSSKDLETEIRDVVRHLDQPFAGVISSFWLSRFIKKHVTVALSGDGADDTFGSYGHHRLVRPIHEIREAAQGLRNWDEVDYGFFRDRKEWVQQLAKQEPWQWRLAYAAFTDSEKWNLLSKKGKDIFGKYVTSEFLREIVGVPLLTTPQQAGQGGVVKSGTPTGLQDHDPLNQMLYLDLQTLLPNEILYYGDMLSMAHSVEVRAPYLDYRLVELANSIPGTLKIKNGILKYILRKVGERYLPKEVLDRPKEGFVLPKNTWLREGLRPLLEETLLPERLELHGFFDLNSVRSLVRKFLAGDDALTFKVWTLVVFQLWYEDQQNVTSHARHRNEKVRIA